MPSFDVTSIGESMLRLSVGAGERLVAARRLDARVAGAESNVLSGLAALGRACSWHSSLPDNDLGRMAARAIRNHGVDTSSVVWKREGRLGTYYVEFAEPPRPIRVTYDRARSCFSQADGAEVDWDALLDTRLLHLTGITPALSPGCRDLCLEAFNRAQEAGARVSFDLNYRSGLWSAEEAAAFARQAIPLADVLLCARADARRLFGFEGEPEEVARQLAALEPNRAVILTLGAEGVLALVDGQPLRQSSLPAACVDRLGAGDALAAGFLHGWLDGDSALGLRYGAVMAALALSQHGDAVITTPEEVAALAEATGSEADLER